MKKYYFLSIAFLVCFVATAQTVTIPDPIFKAKLLAASPSNYVAKNIDGAYVAVDANADGEIQILEAAQIRDLSLNNAAESPESEKIADLAGIASFTNLRNLSCSYNKLTSLDVSMLTLNYLSCSYNLLTAVSLHSNQMTSLHLGHNNLTQIDMSQMTSIEWFNCSYNQLSSLDLSEMSHVDLLGCNNNQLTSLLLPNSICGAFSAQTTC
jgi:hypothetical protein